MSGSLIIFLGIATLSSAVSTVVGFGSALILISATTLVYDIKWSIAITMFLYFFNTTTKTVVFREHIDRPLTLKIYATAFPGVALGSLFLLQVDATYAYLLLGFLSLLYLALDLIGKNTKLAITTPILYLSGLVYGFLSGAAGTGGIIKVLVFRQIQLPKEQFVATMAATAMPLNIVKIGIFVYGGLLVWQDIPIIIGLLLASFLGVYLGKRILSHVSEVLFNHLVRLMLLGLSLRLLYVGLWL